MKRSWAVRPDETGTVSREALIGALVDGATMLDLAGGVLEVVVGRAPTDVPGEMVMTGALLQWKDRTDAKSQPEAPVAVTPPMATHVEARDTQHREVADAYNTGAEVRVEGGSFQPEPSADVDDSDGFDYSKLEEEDIDEPVTAGR